MNFVLFRRKNQAVGTGYEYSFLTLEVEVFDVWKARGWMVSGTGRGPDWRRLSSFVRGARHCSSFTNRFLD